MIFVATLLFCYDFCGPALASFHFQQPKSTLQQHCMCKLNVPSWDSATGLLSIRIVRLFGSSWAGHGTTKAARSTWQDDARLVGKRCPMLSDFTYISSIQIQLLLKRLTFRNWSVGLVAQCNPEISRPVGCFDVTWFAHWSRRQHTWWSLPPNPTAERHRSGPQPLSWEEGRRSTNSPGGEMTSWRFKSIQFNNSISHKTRNSWRNTEMTRNFYAPNERNLSLLMDVADGMQSE